MNNGNLTNKDQAVMVTNFEAAQRIMSKVVAEKLRVGQLLDMFFVDYDLIPLLVQQSYLRVATRKDGSYINNKGGSSNNP